jgi:hypothetical protein
VGTATALHSPIDFLNNFCPAYRMMVLCMMIRVQEHCIRKQHPTIRDTKRRSRSKRID